MWKCVSVCITTCHVCLFSCIFQNHIVTSLHLACESGTIYPGVSSGIIFDKVPLSPFIPSTSGVLECSWNLSQWAQVDQVEAIQKYPTHKNALFHLRHINGERRARKHERQVTRTSSPPSSRQDPRPGGGEDVRWRRVEGIPSARLSLSGTRCIVAVVCYLAPDLILSSSCTISFVKPCCDDAMGDANLKDPSNDNHEGGKIADLEKRKYLLNFRIILMVTDALASY